MDELYNNIGDQCHFLFSFSNKEDTRTLSADVKFVFTVFRNGKKNKLFFCLVASKINTVFSRQYIL